VTASMMVAISRAIHRQDWASALIKLRLAGVPGDAAAHFLAFEIESAETFSYPPGEPR
jgi:hypothetical protein